MGTGEGSRESKWRIDPLLLSVWYCVGRMEMRMIGSVWFFFVFVGRCSFFFFVFVVFISSSTLEFEQESVLCGGSRRGEEVIMMRSAISNSII